MPFDAHSPLLVHAAPSATDAGAWLMGLFGPDPWTGPRATLVAPNLPPWVPQTNPPRQSMDTTVPLQWGRLRLLVWRDGSAVLAEEGTQGWHAWPAVLYLASHLWGGPRTPGVPRGSEAVCLHTRPQQDGLGVRVDHAPGFDISALLEAQARARLEEIQAALPLCDPRACLSPLPGTRFAPFSPFPQADPTTSAQITRLLGAANRLHGVASFVLTRTPAPSPWREPRRVRPPVGWVGTPAAGALLTRATDTTAWPNWLKEVFVGTKTRPGLLPPALLYGPPQGTECWVGDQGAFGPSAHGLLEARAALRAAVPDDLYARMPATGS